MALTFNYGSVAKFDMDRIHPWIGLDWIGLDWIGSEVLSASLFSEDGSAFVQCFLLLK